MAVIAAALVWAAGNIQVKALGDSVDAVQLNGWIAILAAPQLLLASWLIEGPQWQNIPNATWEGWAALLFQGVVIAIFTCLLAVVGFSVLVQALAGVAAVLFKDVVVDKWLKKGTFSYADIAWGIYGMTVVVAPQLI